MKILVLTSTYARRKGDTEPRFVDNLCHYLAAASSDNEIHVVAPHAPGIPVREVMDGIPVFRFRYAPENWQTLAYEGGILPSLKQNRLRLLMVPFFMLSQLLLALKLARKNHYDVIHAHWIIPQGLVAVITRALLKSRPSVVITSHGGDLFALKGELFTRLKLWIIQRADCLTVVSSAMKQKAIEQQLAPSNKITIIPMGVDSQHTFCPPADGSSRRGVLFVGRLVNKKGVEYLIKAMPAVVEKHPDEALTIIGDGPMRKKLDILCQTSGLDGHVQFLGSQLNIDIPHYLKNAAVTVFPSVVTESGDQEGTPVAVMEALACECATVVSDYPGARDIILHGTTGILAAPRSHEQLAQQINRLLSDAGLRQALGNGGRQHVQKNYDWRVVSKAFLSVFTSVEKPAQSS